MTGHYSCWTPESINFIVVGPGVAGTPGCRLQCIALTRCPYLPPLLHQQPALLGTVCAVTSAFRLNNLRRCCCKPTAHCNNSRDLDRAPPPS